VLDAACDHLATVIGIPAHVVRTALHQAEHESGYRPFTLPKAGRGAPRIIAAPAAELKLVQRGVKILLESLPVSSAAHGFRRGRSIVTAARAHIQARVTLHIDLEDFFHSIEASRVYAMLEELFSTQIIYSAWGVPSYVSADLAALITTLTTRQIASKRVLPQGAPTSPILANIIAHPFDNNVLRAVAQSRTKWVYTRYADDLYISSAEEEISEAFRDEMLDLVLESGFRPHPAKTRIRSTFTGSKNYAQKLEFMGLILDHHTKTVRIDRKRMRGFREAIHTASRERPLSPKSVQKVNGIISFARMVYGTVPPPLKTPYSQFRQNLHVSSGGLLGTTEAESI